MASSTRGQIWSEDEVECLISIWGDEKIQEQLQGMRRNQDVYNDIAEKMKELGFDRNAKQVNTKIRGLTYEYNQVVRQNKTTGNDRKTMKYFDQINVILGGRPSSHPQHLLQSASPTPQNDDTPESQSDDELQDTSDKQQDEDAGPAGTDPDQVDQERPENNMDEKDLEPEKQKDAPQTLQLKNEPKKRRSSFAGPIMKRREKQSAASRLEASVSGMFKTFMEQQRESEQNFFQLERERMRLEAEQEEKRRTAEMEQQRQFLQMMFNAGSSSTQPLQSTSRQQDPNQTTAMGLEHLSNYEDYNLYQL